MVGVHSGVGVSAPGMVGVHLAGLEAFSTWDSERRLGHISGHHDQARAGRAGGKYARLRCRRQHRVQRQDVQRRWLLLLGFSQSAQPDSL